MIERTFDYRTVKRMAPWPAVITSNVIYLVEKGKGLWVFHEYKDGMISHVEMDISCRGKDAVDKGKEALEWIFKNTDTDVIYAEIPNENKPAMINAVRGGFMFTHETENKRCYEVKR